MLDSDLVSEDSVMNEAAKFTALTHSRCGRAGDPGEGRGCRGDRLATSQPMHNPFIPWVLLSISYVLGRVLGARVVKTNDTQSLGGGGTQCPRGHFCQREEPVHRQRANDGAAWGRSSHSVELRHRAWWLRRLLLLIMELIPWAIWGKESFLEISYKPS